MPTTKTSTILVVDDDPTLRGTVRDILSEEGYSVRDAPDGEVGLNMLRAQPDRFGLVLLDLMMPRKDGWQFRIEQRNDPTLAGIPVVVMSASVNVKQEGLPVDVAPAAFMPKPFDLHQLLKVVERFIEPEEPLDML